MVLVGGTAGDTAVGPGVKLEVGVATEALGGVGAGAGGTGGMAGDAALEFGRIEVVILTGDAVITLKHFIDWTCEALSGIRTGTARAVAPGACG